MNTSATDQADSEEEILIYAEFNNINIEKYRSIHVLGIDTNNPIIQADDTFFKGKFVHPQGTYMFFEEDPCPQSEDPLFDKLPEKNLKYAFKTNKFLKMEKAYVSSKAAETENPVDKDSNKTINDIEDVKFETIEDAIAKFKSALCPNSDVNLDPKSEIRMEFDNDENSTKSEHEHSI